MHLNKSYARAILKVLTTYKRAMLLGLFLGISLVLGAVVVNQVVGNEEKLCLDSIETVDLYERQAQKQAQKQSQKQSQEQEQEQ